MKIPVFVSSPSTLNRTQEKVRKRLFELLGSMNLEPRALGQSDYPTQLPLREIYTIARHCSGGVILGFSQVRADSGEIKEGTPKKQIIEDPIRFPTPWCQLAPLWSHFTGSLMEPLDWHRNGATSFTIELH